MKNNAEIWKMIWDERGSDYPEDDPIKINGFDQAFGAISEQVLQDILLDIRWKMKLSKDDFLFELGCGVGMLLSLLTPFVKDSYGTDLSENMIARAKKIYPDLKVKVADSVNLPFGDESFDKILIHSVFQYFSGYDYARKVMDECVRILRRGGIIMISDVMDIDKRKAYQELRKKMYEGTIWKSSVKGSPEHLYYKKKYFEEYANANNLKVSIFDRALKGYINAKYRFDVLLTKERQVERGGAVKKGEQ